MGSKCFPVQVYLLLGLFVTLSIVQSQPIVTVEQGTLMGTTETFEESEFIGVNKTIDVFKGVPFAEPPTGPLRFKPPSAKQPWDGTYNATYFRDACVQREFPLQPLPSMSEDCLHLNIYAPRPAIQEGAAVMVWIHGGGFAAGSAITSNHLGQPLVAVGDVIVVTINYRVEVFGFLTTGDEAAPGNIGLLDQVFALKWIKENIAAFGGDSERITIFGESAGGASVSLLLLSELAQGLFKNAILQSGTAFSRWAYADGNSERLRQQAFDRGTKLGCNTQDSVALVDCLRDKDAMAVLTAIEPTGFTSIVPPVVVDGTFLVDTPSNLYSTGRYNHAPLLLGTTRDEATLFALYNPLFIPFMTPPEPPVLNKEIFDQALSAEIAHYYGGTEASNDLLVDAIKQEYVDWSQADNADADYLQSYLDYFTDEFFVSGTDRVARYHAQSGDNVFMYQMTRVSDSVLPPWLGATHGSDPWYVFGCPFSWECQPSPAQSLDDMALSVKFMEFWTTFAKTGNPSLESTSESDMGFWPRFTIPELEYKELDLNLTTKRALKSRECHFWNNYVVHLRAITADMETAQLDWKQALYNWKYTDMANWRDEFDKYKQELN
ncbi:cholinesterase 1-like [Patiria miniata]|uniref:Carboxylic ester hydrolase n=1 Tax=Patiria miniata TaxID=46514 RepID=A0A914AYD2_PATMI|nr:cholinesterase 1-like [Patiria miniata]